MIQHISAVTFAVRAMPEALTFYTTLGFTLIFGGPQSPFSTLQAGEAFVNLMVAPTYTPTWWGRTIFRVEDVDALYQTGVCAGSHACRPTAEWPLGRALLPPDGSERA